MDISQSNWSETDASNSSAPPDGFPFGMLPSGENTGARAIMGAVKRWWNRMKPTTTDSGGTNTAYTLTYAVAPGGYVDGETYLVRFDKTCGTSPTLNVMSLGAIALYKYSGGAWVAVAAGDITANMICRLSYNQTAGAFFITSASATAIGAAFLAVASTFTAAQSMSGAAFNEGSVTLASASTVDIGAAGGNYIFITGTTSITAFDTVQSGAERETEFAGILTLTHGTDVITLTGGDVVTAAGDIARWRSEGSGVWRMVGYERATGSPLAFSPAAAAALALANDVSLTGTGYQDGPSVTLAAGIWRVQATGAARDTSTGPCRFYARLWDGTTVYDSLPFHSSSGQNYPAAFALVATITLAASTTIKLSVRDVDGTTGLLLANYTGDAKDTMISAYRIG